MVRASRGNALFKHIARAVLKLSHRCHKSTILMSAIQIEMLPIIQDLRYDSCIISSIK